LDITYKNNKIKKVCTDAKTAEKTYGQEMADKKQQRIDEISAADTVEMMIQFHIGRCHPLTQKKRAIRGGFGSSVQIGIREEWRRHPNSKQFGIVDYHLRSR